MASSTPAGSYVVKVDVRSSSAVDSDVSATMPFDLVAPPAATGVTVTADKTSPQAPGTSVTFTAAGEGSSGYQYRFNLSSNGGSTWMAVSNWSTFPSYTLGSTTAIGNYLVNAEVRTTTTVTRDAVSANVPFTITTLPATGVTLAASPSSPAVYGTPVTFTATGQGSSGYQYRFWYSNNNGISWFIAANWSATNTFVLGPTTAPATYQVYVEVRTSTLVTRDAVSSTVPFTIVAPPATGVTLTANKTSPQAQGTAVVFTAAGQGAFNYQYRFYLSSNNGVSWTLVQNWGSYPSYTLPSTVAKGSYLVNAEVRTSTLVVRDAVSPNVPMVIN